MYLGCFEKQCNTNSMKTQTAIVYCMEFDNSLLLMRYKMRENLKANYQLA